MSPQSVSCNALRSAAENREISVSAIDAILGNTQDDSQIADWVDKNLVQSKPLTAEELTLWKFLREGASNRHQDARVRIHNCLPLTEDALEEAIRDLELSTTSFQANVHALETQQHLLSASRSFPGASSDRATSLGSRSIKKEAAQGQQLAFINRELVLELEEKTRFSSDRVSRYRKMVSSTVTERLRTDDRALRSIESFQLEASFGTKNSKDTAERSNSLIATLRYITVQWLKTRLDRIYLQELTSLYSSSSKDDPASDDVQVQQIEHDLQLLYTEIEDVSSMLIENEYGNELKNLENETSVHIASTKASNAHEAISTLEGMVRSLDKLTRQYELLQNHHHMLDCLEKSLSQTAARSSMSSDLSQFAQSDQQPGLAGTDQDPSEFDKLDAFLRHMNIDTPREITSDGSNIDVILQKFSTDLAREKNDLVQALTTIMERSASTAQTRLRYLNRGNSLGLFGEINRRIQVLDDQIAAVRGKVDAEVGTTSQRAEHKEGCADVAMRFARRQSHK